MKEYMIAGGIVVLVIGLVAEIISYITAMPFIITVILTALAFMFIILIFAYGV